MMVAIHDLFISLSLPTPQYSIEIVGLDPLLAFLRDVGALTWPNSLCRDLPLYLLLAFNPSDGIKTFKSRTRCRLSGVIWIECTAKKGLSKPLDNGHSSRAPVSRLSDVVPRDPPKLMFSINQSQHGLGTATETIRRWFEDPSPCERGVTGRLCPVVGAETFICKSTVRPGMDSIAEMNEMTGVGTVTGISLASPIDTWCASSWLDLSTACM